MHAARHTDSAAVEAAVDDRPPSKSQKKRDSLALQDLGGELVALSSAQLARVDMPDALRLAVREAQRINSNGAKRRQIQYIGRLMREADPTPIQAALDAIKGVSAAAKAREQRLERLRARLIENEQGLADIAIAFASADLQQLRQLRRNALKEQELGKPPRAFREIFRVLRELDNAAAQAPADNPEAHDDDQ
jgi:ribosome-associated protein